MACCANWPACLQVAFEVAAGGEAACALEAGQAARIFTGAPVPPGADSVIMQEQVETRRGGAEIGEELLRLVVKRRGTDDDDTVAARV